MENIKFSPNKYSRRLPYTYARANKVCIYAVDDDYVQIATTASLNPLVVTEIKRKVQQPIQIHKIVLMQLN